MHEQKHMTCSHFPTNFTFITSACAITKKQQKHLLFPTQISAHHTYYSITASSHNEHTQRTIQMLFRPLKQRALFSPGMKYEHPAHTICSHLDHPMSVSQSKVPSIPGQSFPLLLLMPVLISQNLNPRLIPSFSTALKCQQSLIYLFWGGGGPDKGGNAASGTVAL
jgi:hypothetical protein